MVTDKCYPSSHKHSSDMSHGARPKPLTWPPKALSSWSSQRFHNGTVAPTAAHSPHDLKNPPPVPWCPIPEDTQTGPVSHVRVLWADNVRAVWMAFKSHTCTHTYTIESFPSRVCPALTSKSVQSEKRTTAALKDHHALSFTHPQTRTAHTYS